MFGFLNDRRGSTAIVTACMMPVILSCVAFVVDVASLRSNRSTLQLAADAGALAAVQNLSRADGVRLALANVPQSYGTVTRESDVELGTYDARTKLFTVGPNGNAVRVTAVRDEAHGNLIQGYFTRFISQSQTFAARAQAVAVKEGGSDACVVTLDTVNPVVFRGSSTINAGCGMQVNSTIQTDGVHQIVVPQDKYVSLAGQNTNPTWGFSVNPGKNLKTGAKTVADPLAGLAEPTPTKPCVINNYQSPGYGSVTLEPCTYTGSFRISGGVSVILSPGTYLFTGNVSFSGGTTINGGGVTLVLGPNATIDISGGVRATLVAPTSGLTQGILLFQSRAASRGIDLSGGTYLRFNGIIYTPSTVFEMSGGSDMVFGALIVKNIRQSGGRTLGIGQFGAAAVKRAATTSGKSALVM